MANLHKGHRARLKKRFLNEGLDHFEPHQVLELVLFHVIPQQDTNPLAHKLIQRFGSLAGVFDASVEDLMSVEGIKESAATYLKMFPAVLCSVRAMSCFSTRGRFTAIPGSELSGTIIYFSDRNYSAVFPECFHFCRI